MKIERKKRPLCFATTKDLELADRLLRPVSLHDLVSSWIDGRDKGMVGALLECQLQCCVPGEMESTLPVEMVMNCGWMHVVMIVALREIEIW